MAVKNRFYVVGSNPFAFSPFQLMGRFPTKAKAEAHRKECVAANHQTYVFEIMSPSEWADIWYRAGDTDEQRARRRDRIARKCGGVPSMRGGEAISPGNLKMLSEMATIVCGDDEG